MSNFKMLCLLFFSSFVNLTQLLEFILSINYFMIFYLIQITIFIIILVAFAYYISCFLKHLTHEGQAAMQKNDALKWWWCLRCMKDVQLFSFCIKALLIIIIFKNYINNYANYVDEIFHFSIRFFLASLSEAKSQIFSLNIFLLLYWICFTWLKS